MRVLEKDGEMVKKRGGEVGFTVPLFPIARRLSLIVLKRQISLFVSFLIISRGNFVFLCRVRDKADTPLLETRRGARVPLVRLFPPSGPGILLTVKKPGNRSGGIGGKFARGVAYRVLTRTELF